MELVQLFNSNIETSDISESRLRYLSTLMTITDKIKKYPELQDITSMLATDLEQHTLPKIRRLAHCIGITQPHTVPSKEQLIQKIVHTYKKILNTDTNKTEHNEDEEKEMENIVPSPSLHEQRVQRALNIGDPLSYDSDEYYDLDYLQEVYADYSVHFFRKNDRTCLSVKSMDIFFTRALLSLFLKHYRCFKNINKEWYKYTNETDRWEKVHVYDIDNFVRHVYERIESIARMIDKELSRAFSEMNEDLNRDYKYVVLRNASIALQKCIKTCS